MSNPFLGDDAADADDLDGEPLEDEEGEEEGFADDEIVEPTCDPKAGGLPITTLPIFNSCQVASTSASPAEAPAAPKKAPESVARPRNAMVPQNLCIEQIW